MLGDQTITPADGRLLLCRRCSVEKPPEDYYPSCLKRRACKACCAEKNRAWRVNNRERTNRNERERIARQPIERRRARWRRHYSKHRDQHLARTRQWHLDHAEQFKAYQKTWARENRERRRVLHLIRTYGLTPERRAELLAAQGGGCAICGTEENWAGRRLATDHCHRTEIVRGLLCNNCNVAIGLLAEDPRLAERMAEYLRAAGGKNALVAV